MTAPFRDFVPPPGHPRYRGLDLDAHAYADLVGAMLDERLAELNIPPEKNPFRQAVQNLLAPYRGITTDGHIEQNLYGIGSEGVPVELIVSAANRVLKEASPTERTRLVQPLASPNWRRWGNPELYFNRHGLRLDEIPALLRSSILNVLRVSLSDYGYAKARDCMFMNDFLGRVMGAPKIMNEFSYNFTLFGEPSTEEPWGWQFHGHHLVMNCLVYRDQMVMTPCFWGAEPNEVDEGPRKGLKLFQDEELGGLALMQSLPKAQFARAQLWANPYDDPSVPPDRVHLADHLHLAGLSQDNRMIPYEGVEGSEFAAPQRTRLLQLIEQYHRHLLDGPRHARMSEIERHLDKTRFCWIGGIGPDDPFYYRIQSPVMVIEFDHHAGVFLTNQVAKKFHIHTLMRTPNGNDYGMALVRQHCERHQREVAGLDLV